MSRKASEFIITPRKLRSTLTPAEKNTTTWAQVNTSGFSEEKRETFEVRRQAVHAYMADEPVKKIVARLPISEWELRRLKDRCLEAHPDGRIWGDRALVPGIRLVRYERTAEPLPTNSPRRRNMVGMLTRTLNLYNDAVARPLYSYVLKKRRQGVAESLITGESSYAFFIGLCKKAGISRKDYPFNTMYQGQEALRRHLKRLLKSDLYAAVRALSGDEAARTSRTQTGYRRLRVIQRPLQRVLFDGHRIDAIFILRVPHRNGGFIDYHVERPWLLVVLDVRSRAVLGWSLCFEHQYAQGDVLRCVKRAIVPWKRPVLTVTGLKFHPDAAMPSEAISALQWAVWSEMEYDNLSSHDANSVRRLLKEAIGCALNPGAVHFPERRAILERFFKVLEERYLHRLPNTTGSNPGDKRRNNPGKAAVGYRLTVDHLFELLAVCISDYNATPTSALAHRSPLDQLRFDIEEDKAQVRTLSPEDRPRLRFFGKSYTRTVAGNPQSGRRPYIEFFEERYTSYVLAESPELIGKELTLFVDEDDITTILAFLPNGAELGILEPTGHWAGKPHSLFMRRANNSRKYLKIDHRNKDGAEEPIHVFLEGAGRVAPKSRRHAVSYDTARRQAAVPETYHPEAKKSTKSRFSIPPVAPREMRSKKKAFTF